MLVTGLFQHEPQQIALTKACRKPEDMLSGDGASTSATGGLLRGGPNIVRHPGYPHLPDAVPLTYTLAMKACLGEAPQERPHFAQLRTLLLDVVAEVARGRYVNTAGHASVRRHRSEGVACLTLAPCVLAMTSNRGFAIHHHHNTLQCCL